jgi:hypothetical protein
LDGYIEQNKNSESMKTFNKYFVSLLVLAIAISGCKKDPDPVSTVVEVTYPQIVLNGPPAILIPVGGSYTDEGATLTDDITGEVSQITATSNDLDASTPGMYAMTYEAANANGFRTSVVRNILVLDYTPVSGLTVDLSGEWVRLATGVSVFYTKVAEGLYVLDKIGGSTLVPAYMLQLSDTQIDIPVQTSLDGLIVEGTDEELTITPTDTTIAYKVVAEGFGTSLRTFQKVN